MSEESIKTKVGEVDKMRLYAEPDKPDISSLVVTFSLEHRGDGRSSDQYDWKVTGAMPMMELIGYVGKVQRGLQDPQQCRLADCTERVLVIQWFKDHRRFGWYTHKDTPVDAMCGMLEMVKQTLVMTIRHQQSMAAIKSAGMPNFRKHPSIVGLDGRPVEER